MDTIQIKDKLFTVSIKEQEIQKEVIRVANEINRDLAGKNPLFLSVLNGSFMFTADLLKHITIPCEISFVKLASYQGITSTGVIKEVIGLNEDIAGRTIVIVEDIVDTGLTMQRLLETLGTRNPEAIHIASLLVKPEKLKVNLNIEYVAMEIPNDFIVGYGLDYDQKYRNLSLYRSGRAGSGRDTGIIPGLKLRRQFRLKQQQTFQRFLCFIILMLILLMLALRFSLCKAGTDGNSPGILSRFLGSGNVAEAVISPNPQTPSGYVTVTLANGQTVRQNVSDVKDAEQLFKGQ